MFVATLDHYLVVFYRQGEGHVGVGASLGELGKVLALDAGVFEGVLVAGKVLVGVGAHAVGFYEGDGVEVVVLGGENGAFPPTRDGCIHSLSMRERG